MDKSASVVFASVGILLLAVFLVGLLGELISAFLKVEYLSPLKSKEQWQLETDLSWKCFLANYAWRLRFRFAVEMSKKASAELEEWTKGEAPQVVVRFNPDSPSGRRYRLYSRFDLSS